MEEMANSLLNFGQLQPIGVDSDDNLVYGLHRLEAAKHLGWTTIACIRKDQLTDVEHREQELEENIRRKEMSPAQTALAIAAIDDLKRATNPKWTQGQTAIALKLPRGNVEVSEMVKVAKMIKLYPELSEAKSIKQLKSWAEHRAASAIRAWEVRDNQIDYGPIAEKIWLGDSVEEIKKVPSDSFHAIITDPPFGISYDERTAGQEGSLTSYEDSEESYERLLSMADDLYRVIRPSGWLVWFLGISWYERAKNVFRSAGFVVDEIPIVWDRSAGRCFTNRPDRYFAKSYDIALHCLKGNPQIVGKRGLSNILAIPPVPSDDRDALVERPIELYAELIRRLTIPGEIVADFFVGSGSCPAAAASLGRDYFGIELDPDRRDIALKKILAHSPS